MDDSRTFGLSNRVQLPKAAAARQRAQWRVQEMVQY